MEATCLLRWKKIVIEDAVFKDVRNIMVIYTINSSISIDSSSFVSNRADGVGGVLVACRSTVTITASTFFYNKANHGGVIFTSESTVIIDKSSFMRSMV